MIFVKMWLYLIIAPGPSYVVDIGIQLEKKCIYIVILLMWEKYYLIVLKR